jgi:hypothetical protein
LKDGAKRVVHTLRVSRKFNGYLAVCNLVFLILLTAAGAFAQSSVHSKTHAPAKSPKSKNSDTWHFAVSGDSRNCGDVVVPAIAASAKSNQAIFYWHLGDLRWISDIDQDYRQLALMHGKRLTILDYHDYLSHAWDNFIQNQIQPFGNTPFYVGIGNHDVIYPKTRADFISKFSPWLDTNELRSQRLKDDPNAKDPQTYYHWLRDGIDFINLDNASKDEFDASQMMWLEGILRRDEADPSIRTIVVGMHEALPNSISANHSMNESPFSTQTGEQVYHDLLDAQNKAYKKIYVLASHSHYFMDGIFQTDYWKTHGGILAGWIVGTAGAERYPLPPDAVHANAAKEYIYGYLLATVDPPGGDPGTIHFEFKQLDEDQIPATVVNRFTAPFVHQCFIGNRRTIPVQ